MKILMLTDRMGLGGAETHIMGLARALRDAGETVTVASAGGHAATLLEAAGIRHVCLPLGTHNPFRWLLVRRALRRMIKHERYDVLHAHARIPAFVARGLPVPCVTTVHARFKAPFLLKRLCNWGVRTVAVSEDLRTYVCDTYRIPAEQVRMIPNGIDCTRFSPSANGFSTACRRILFASRLDLDCSLGATLLCRIAPTLCQRFDGLEIRIAGAGNARETVAALAEEANARIGRAAVTLVGSVSDMPPLLRRADVFVGVSRAAMEAAACGCAVILCGNEGYGGILCRESAERASLSNFCCRGYPQASAEQLTEDLCRLCSSAHVRRQCASEARKIIAEAFSEARACRDTLAVYREVCPVPQDKHITVGGYFGCGNAGDDLIFQGFLTEFRRAYPDIAVTALTNRPRQNSRRFGVPCRARRDPITAALLFLRSDAFLCGGGSLLQNATSNRSLLYYLLLLRLSRACRAKAVLYAAGIGPLHGKTMRRLTASVLKKCDYISLRDPSSMLLLERMSIDRARLHLGADPALLLPLPPPSRAQAMLAELGIPPQRAYFCVVLRGGAQGADVVRITVAAARMLALRHGMLPLFVVLDPDEDLRPSRRAAAILGGYTVRLREATDATAILSRAAFAITMRLHALILAATVELPALGVCSDPYDQKIPAFARLSAEEFLPLEEVTVGALVARAEAMLEQRASRRPILRDAVSDLRKKAQKDLANIVTMLYNNSSSTL